MICRLDLLITNAKYKFDGLIKHKGGPLRFTHDFKEESMTNVIILVMC